MDHNWPYVAAGYGITLGTLGVYVVWLQRKLATARRMSLPTVPTPLESAGDCE